MSLDQGNSTGSPTTEKVTPASVDDGLDELVNGITAITRDGCAMLAASIGQIVTPDDEYQRGYRAAAFEIAAQIRLMNFNRSAS